MIANQIFEGPERPKRPERPKMVLNSITGHKNYDYCLQCQMVRSKLTGTHITPKNGYYFFFDGKKIVRVHANDLLIEKAQHRRSFRKLIYPMLAILLIIVYSIIMAGEGAPTIG